MVKEKGEPDKENWECRGQGREGSRWQSRTLWDKDAYAQLSRRPEQTDGL